MSPGGKRQSRAETTRAGPPRPALPVFLAALGRKVWLFAGSDRSSEQAAAIYALIVTTKLNGVDPRAWLADVLRRIADHPASRLHELLPWNWNNATRIHATAA